MSAMDDLSAVTDVLMRATWHDLAAHLLVQALEAADKADPDPSRFYSGEVTYGSYEDHAEAVLNARAALKEQPR